MLFTGIGDPREKRREDGLVEATLRGLLRKDGCLTLPGVYDGISARVAANAGFDALYMLWVLVPACLPEIVNGLRISFSLTFLGVLIGEMFSSQRGLGFLLVNGMAQHNVPLSTAVVTVIVVVSIAANSLMLRLRVGTAHRSN